MMALICMVPTISMHIKSEVVMNPAVSCSRHATSLPGAFLIILEYESDIGGTLNRVSPYTLIETALLASSSELGFRSFMRLTAQCKDYLS